MEPKNYSTIRSVLKKEQGEKITYEIYQEERKIINHKRAIAPMHGELEPRKKRKLEKI